MEDEVLSLYDYLGKAAGPELGKQVNELAKTKNIKYLSIFGSLINLYQL